MPVILEFINYFATLVSPKWDKQTVVTPATCVIIIKIKWNMELLVVIHIQDNAGYRGIILRNDIVMTPKNFLRPMISLSLCQQLICEQLALLHGINSPIANNVNQSVLCVKQTQFKQGKQVHCCIEIDIWR